MSLVTHYQTLGIDQNASQGEIKNAYRKMALQYHPDTNQSDKTKEALFLTIKDAYDILGNTEKKSLYDRYIQHHPLLNMTAKFSDIEKDMNNIQDIQNDIQDIKDIIKKTQSRIKNIIKDIKQSLIEIEQLDTDIKMNLHKTVS